MVAPFEKNTIKSGAMKTEKEKENERDERQKWK